MCLSFFTELCWCVKFGVAAVKVAVGAAITVWLAAEHNRILGRHVFDEVLGADAAQVLVTVCGHELKAVMTGERHGA